MGDFSQGNCGQAFNSGKIKFTLPYRSKISSDVIQRLISTEKLYVYAPIVSQFAIVPLLKPSEMANAEPVKNRK